MLIDCWAQTSQDALTRAIDTAAKRLMMVIKVMVAMLNFVWTSHVLFHCMFSEIEQNPFAIVKFGVISRGVNICAN